MTEETMGDVVDALEHLRNAVKRLSVQQDEIGDARQLKINCDKGLSHVQLALNALSRPAPSEASGDVVEAVAELRLASAKLLEACQIADARENLSEEIDGSDMDRVANALEAFHPIVFTDAQVECLKAFQASAGHVLTCGGDRGDEYHRLYADENGEDMGQLEPTPRGLVCPVCDYRQTYYPAVINTLTESQTDAD